MTTRRGPRPPEEGRQAENGELISVDLVGVIVRLMPDAAIVVDDEGSIVAANPLAEGLFGYPAGVLEGQPVERLVPLRLRPRHAAHRTTYTAQPTQRPMGAGLDLWAKRHDDSEFPVDISLAPLGVPERPLTLAAVRDLTQRRSEWAEIGRLAAIVSTSDDAIVSMDLDGIITSWNPGAHRLLGYSAEEMLGRPIFELVPASHRAEVEEQLADARAGMRIAPFDTRRVARDRNEIDVSESLSLIRDPSGEPVGFAWLMSDITERKRAEGELRRLLAETQRREHWLQAISDIRLRLLSGEGLDEWLGLIARRVCELVDSAGSTILLTGEQLGFMRLAASAGEAFAPPSPEEVPVAGSILGYLLASEEVLTTDDLAKTHDAWDHGHIDEVGREGLVDVEKEDGLGALDGAEANDPTPADVAHPLSPVPAPDLFDPARLGPSVAAPLATSHGSAGVLVVSRGRDQPAFDNEDVRMIESFAQQAGLAVEIARAQSDRSQLTLMADRERIARDLHDHVIQRLFAVGMALQAATNSVTNPRALERINDSVEELDATIRDVRSTIFSLELRATERLETSARSQVLDVASKAAAGLGFQPRLQFDGPVDTRVPEGLVPDLLAVVRESLSNAARHAAASSVEVGIAVHDDLVVTVTDDGRGLHGASRLSGLANLRIRAEGRGGSMAIERGARGGTRIVWRTPLP